MIGERLAPEDRDAVAALIDAIHDDDQGCYTASAFDQLFSAAHMAQSVSDTTTVSYGHLSAALAYSTQLRSLVLKTDWLAEQRHQGDLRDETWMFFCASDVLAFHVVMRSLFDELAATARSAAAKPGGVPDSFKDLRKWLSKEDGEVRDRRIGELGPNLATLIAESNWFDTLREVRDDLVHRGAQPIVLLVPDEIAFVVHRSQVRQSLPPAVMFNENAVDFTKYAALLLARITVLADSMAEAIFAAHEELMHRRTDKVHSWNPGLRVLKRWSTRLLEADGT